MRRRAPTQLLAVLAGAALLLLGVAGFVPGVTAHLGSIRFAGGRSHAELAGTFKVSVLLNLLHLALGVGLLVVARRAGAVRGLLLGGTLLLALWALGAIAAGRFVPLSPADNQLHFGLGIALLGVTAL